MANGIKYPVHISVPLDDHKIDWLTVKCDNEDQLKQALLDSHANSELFKNLGIGDTSVDYAKLQAAKKGEYKSPPNHPLDNVDMLMEEYAEMSDIGELIKDSLDKPDINKNTKYPGKSKHYFNRQINDVCEHDNHVSSNCSDCYDEQIYQHLAIKKLHREITSGSMTFVEFVKDLWLRMKVKLKDYQTKRIEERAYNDYMSGR